MLSENEIIVESIIHFGADFDPRGDNPLLKALEQFYMNGSPDDVCGSVEFDAHYYRVNRWIVQTDSQGFSEILSYDSEEKAQDEMRKLEKAIYPYA